MSETHTIEDFEDSQFRDLIRGFECPANDGECGQLVKFSSFEGGETNCPRCGAQITLSVEVDEDGGRDPTR